MFTGVQKIAIYDPTLFTSVVLNKIAPDADILVKKPIEIFDINHNLIYDGDESHLEFGCYDLEGYDQVKAYMDAGTLINLVAAGLDYNLLWHENTKLTCKKSYGFAVGNRNFFTVKLQKERGSHNIHTLSNIVRYNGRWIDINADEKVDGMIFVGSGTYNFVEATGYQQITGGATGDIATTNRINFPIPGVTLYAKMNMHSTGGPAPEWTFTLSAWDSSNNLLDSETATNSDDILSLLLPANTFKIRAQIEVANTKVVRFYLPYLGVQRSNYFDINF